MKLRRMGKLAGYVGFAVIAFLGGAAGNLLTSTPTATAAAPPGFAKRVVARQFVVVDDLGRSRIQLGVVQKSTMVTFYDAKGKLRMNLSLMPNGMPGVILADGKGTPRIHFSALDDNVALSLYSKNGNMAAMLGSRTIDKTGEITALNIWNAKTGKDGVILGCVSQKGAALGLFDKNGKQVWGAP